jgi:hypothetical protein
VLTGKCLCGGVRFEISGPVRAAVYCHCSPWRRASGSAFAANAGVAKSDFRFVAGEELLRSFESSPKKLRWFCSRCGSPIYSVIPAAPDVVRIRLGTLDGDPGIRPGFHIFVGSKAPWHEITDRLPRFDERPPRKTLSHSDGWPRRGASAASTIATRNSAAMSPGQ